MSPEKTTGVGNHVDAILSLVSICALTFLSTKHPEWPANYVIGSIVALGVRSTALVVNAARLAQAFVSPKAPE